MTSHERLLAVLRGETPDRLPFSPFLAYWWESMPQLHERGELAFLQEVGADPLLRGAAAPLRVTRPHCEERVTRDGSTMRTVLATPRGDLTLTHTYAERSNTWFLTGHPVRTEDDFAALIAYFEDAVVEPDLPLADQLIDSVGQNGLVLPLFNLIGKSSFQSLVEHWVGTEQLAYALYDFPDTVEEALAVLQKKSLASTELALACKAEAMLFFEDTSTANYSPAWFDRFIAPEISAWARLFHQSGKLLVHHACGSLRGVLASMAATGIDAIESISPPPTGDIELWDAAELLPEHITLIGGIEPTVIRASSMDEYDAYVRTLIERMRSRRFILANSDSCPPGTAIEKFTRVPEIIASLSV